MIDLSLYHWVWYLLGFIFCTRITIMVLISLYFKEFLPTWLFVTMWILAILQPLELTFKSKK